MIFNDDVKTFLKTSKYSNIGTQIIEFKILDNLVVIFQALKTSPALLTLVASATSLASTAQFPQKLPDSGGLIIPSTKMTNTGPFFWNGSSKIQIFTDIWYLLCRGCYRQPL